MSFIDKFLDESIEILKRVDRASINKMLNILLDLRQKGGRLFFVGVGGSAGNCSHAVNDFRKLAGFDAYSPVDNVPELTARTNDEGWHTIFSEWLKTSNLNEKDAVFVLSVGGGNKEKNISANIVYALELARERGARIVGIVGRDGGYTAQVADACVIIPTVHPEHVTPQSESMQVIIWHLIVSDPQIKQMEYKWETTMGR